LLPIVAFVAALTSVSPALADVTWQSLGTWSAATAQSFDPQVAVDANGNSVYVWIWYGGNLCSGAPCRRIQTRTRSAAGVLSPIYWITTQGQQANDPQVAVDANGDAAIVWQTNHQIQTKLRAAAATFFGPSATLSPPGPADKPQVAVDPNGTAVYAWQHFDGTHERIQTRTLSLSGTRGTTLTLSPATQDAENAQVALDAHGNAVFAWESSDGTTQRIQTRTRSAAGTLGPIQTLVAGQYASDVHLAVDPSGDAVFAWQGYDGTVSRIQTRSRSAAGALGPTHTLSTAGQNAYLPQVGIDSGGNAVILWQRFDGVGNIVQVRARSAADVLSSTQTLAATTGTTVGVRADLAVDPHGNALVVWEHQVGTAVCCRQVQARARLADGTLGTTRTLSTAGKDAQEPQVAVDPNGHAFAVWDEQTTAQTTDGRIHAAAGSY
jgi:hypothetical protein